jgi:hypothetical protein
MKKQERILAVMETLSRHPNYDFESVVKELIAIDGSDSFILDAVGHIQGANGKGSFRKHDHMQNLSWARSALRNYISERLES